MTDALSPLRDPAFMEAFLNLVIPPSVDGVMPGAGSIGIGDAVVAAVEADERSGPVISAAFELIASAAIARNPDGLAGLLLSERLEVVNGALDEYPMLMMSIARHLYPAYYQHLRVLEGLGEPARPPFPLGFEIEPTDERLLAILHARRK